MTFTVVAMEEGNVEKQNAVTLLGGQEPSERSAFEAGAVFGIKVQHGACQCREANDSSVAESAPQSLHTLSYVGYYIKHTLFRIYYIIMKGTTAVSRD